MLNLNILELVESNNECFPAVQLVDLKNEQDELVVMIELKKFNLTKFFAYQR